MSQISPVQIQKFLGGIDYPCDRDEIIFTAEANGADDNVLDLLSELPDGLYEGPNAISEAVS
ncbi:DUF2795 domain-containing protein [Nocardia paucivorans]|uniref:DUF2795 domain-containing protein n=1 Tax=Nocardia paucivorans TaxID=114259 RepID=UPI0005936E4E|nr:DUF2795 domain-containing protein [Nocardia paucivorans]